MKEYKTRVYTIEEAIEFHKELARPEMLNNSDGFLYTRLTLDMTTKKKVTVPHLFSNNFFVKDTIYFNNFNNKTK
jgi:hypothetical protein